MGRVGGLEVLARPVYSSAMPDRKAADPASPPADSIPAVVQDGGDPGAPRAISDIVQRLQTPVSNPVSRARLRVEQEVPLSQRGPGWDRHWRELEAYLEVSGRWSVEPKSADPD